MYLPFRGEAKSERVRLMLECAPGRTRTVLDVATSNSEFVYPLPPLPLGSMYVKLARSSYEKPNAFVAFAFCNDISAVGALGLPSIPMNPFPKVLGRRTCASLEEETFVRHC